MTHFTKTIVISLLLMAMGATTPGCWPKVNPDPVRVRMLYSIGGKGDHGWNDTSYTALLTSRANSDTVFIEAQPLNHEEASTFFYQWLADPTGDFRELIVANSGQYTDLVAAGECNFGTRKVLLFEGEVTGCEAVKSVVYHSYAAAFIAGAAAARFSQTGGLAVVAESAIEEAVAIAQGFCAGVAYADDEAECHTHYIPVTLTGVTDTPVRQAWAHNYEVIKWAQFYYEHKNVDVIFGVTDRDNTALFEVAEAKDGRYAVGLNSDQSVLAPSIVIGSVVRRINLTLNRTIVAFEHGSFASGVETVGYSCRPEGGLSGCTTSAECGAHQGCHEGKCVNELDFVVSPQFADPLGERPSDDEDAALAASAEFYGSGANQCN